MPYDPQRHHRRSIRFLGNSNYAGVSELGSSPASPSPALPVNGEGASPRFPGAAVCPRPNDGRAIVGCFGGMIARRLFRHHRYPRTDAVVRRHRGRGNVVERDHSPPSPPTDAPSPALRPPTSSPIRWVPRSGRPNPSQPSASMPGGTHRARPSGNAMITNTSSATTPRPAFARTSDPTSLRWPNKLEDSL